MRQDKDRSSKWLIGHHGNSILRLGGYEGAHSWKTSQAEVVAPRRWPDGILEVQFADSADDELVLIEIETCASSDLDRRVHEKLLLVDLEKGIIPDVVILVLRPKGNIRSEVNFQGTSFRKSAQVTSSWRMIELWKLRADPC